MSIDARRRAEAAMARRDRLAQGGRRGQRAAARSRAPDFLQSDDDGYLDDLGDGGLLSGMKRRARRDYDERRDIDDMEGVEDVRSSFVTHESF